MLSTEELPRNQQLIPKFYKNGVLYLALKETLEGLSVASFAQVGGREYMRREE